MTFARYEAAAWFARLQILVAADNLFGDRNLVCSCAGMENCIS